MLLYTDSAYANIVRMRAKGVRAFAARMHVTKYIMRMRAG